MADDPQEVGPSNLLNSWKGIAVFLDRGVRTVQRWEKHNQLPVHRYGDSPRAAVFAFEAELLLWLHTRKLPKVSDDEVRKASHDEVRKASHDDERETVRQQFSNMRTADLILRARLFKYRARELRRESAELRRKKLKAPFPAPSLGELNQQ